MLLSLYDVLVTKSFDNGIVIMQDIAGRELFLEFEDDKEWLDYIPTLPTEYAYYDVTFEAHSTYWRKGQKYFTNAVLISIELS